MILMVILISCVIIVVMSMMISITIVVMSMMRGRGREFLPQWRRMDPPVRAKPRYPTPPKLHQVLHPTPQIFTMHHAPNHALH